MRIVWGTAVGWCVVIGGCGGSAGPAPVPAPVSVENPAKKPAAERLGRSVSRLDDAIDGWKNSWVRSGRAKRYDVEKLLRGRAERARGWAGFPPDTPATLKIAAQGHREMAAKLFGTEDAELISDLDADAVTKPGNAGRNALMSGALESSQRLRAALEDVADALVALADALPAK